MSDYELPAPGEHHAKLKPFEGTFRANVTLWFGPDQKMESQGTMVNRFVLNGLYLEQNYVGDPNEEPYLSFEGKGFWGFNTFTNQYEAIWLDNAASLFQNSTGSVDETGTVFTMTGEVPNPKGGTTTKKSIIKVTDQNHHSVESFVVGTEGEFKTMELQYARQQ